MEMSKIIPYSTIGDFSVIYVIIFIILRMHNGDENK